MTINETNALGKTACVIVAGGSGSRMGREEPKQFCLLGGEPVLAHAVRFFGNHPAVDRVIVVVPKEWLAKAAELLFVLDFLTPLSIVAGGALRQESVYAGVAAAADCDYVAIHDGARPFPPKNFDEGLALAKKSGAAVFAMPATDSIKRADGIVITQTIPRMDLWAVQTPQIFSREKLMLALESCHENQVQVTDDASAFEFMGWEVALVTGSRSNIKITYPEDFVIAEALLKGNTQ